MPADMNEYFKSPKQKENDKRLKDIQFPELEKNDFKLCETVDDVINSKAFKHAIYIILNNRLNYNDAVNQYKKLVKLISDDVIPLDDLNKVKKLLDYYYDEFKSDWDSYIRGNIVTTDTMRSYSLDSSDILNKLINKTITNKFNNYFNWEKNESLVELYEKIKTSNILYEELMDSKEHYIIKNWRDTYVIDKKNNTVSNYNSEKIDWDYHLLSWENNSYCVILWYKNKIYKFHSKIKPKISMEISLPVEITVIISTWNEIKLLDEKFEVKGNFNFDEFTTLRDKWVIIKKDWLNSFVDLQWKELVSWIKWEIYIKENNLYEKRKIIFDKQLTPDYS